MNILPFELALTVSAALAVFWLGIVAWWSNKWSRGNVIFALIAFTLALWTSVDWFRDLETTALPVQVIVWRMLFYVSVALAPAFAIHLATIVARRPLGFWGGVAYIVGLGHFLVLDTAFLMRSVFGEPGVGLQILDHAAEAGIVIHIIAFFIIASLLYPILHHGGATLMERRRSTYALLILIVYLVAGAGQFVMTSLPPLVLVTVLSVIFFVLSSAAFIRTRFLGIDFAVLESLFLVLAAGSVVTVLRATTFNEGAVALIGAACIGLFGVRAIRVVRGESRRRRELERINADLIRLDEARRDLVAAVAHQLRSPLGGIRFSADMFIEGDYGPLNENGKQAMRHIRTSADRLLALAETSLNAARLETGLFQSSPSPVDVTAEIRDLKDSLEVMAAAKGIEIKLSFGNVPAQVRLDREAFRNAVFNVMDNAVKYTERGNVLVEADADDRLLSIVVADTGAGMSKEDLKGLFGKFARGQEGRKRSTDGSGLGLYVARKLLEEMGGTITASSPGPGNGSTFRIHIPLKS